MLTKARQILPKHSIKAIKDRKGKEEKNGSKTKATKKKQ